MTELSPISSDEAETFAAKFAEWTAQLTDRERLILGTALAASRNQSIATATETAVMPSTGPVIGAVLLQVAALIVMVGQVQAKAAEDAAAAKDREAGVRDQAAGNRHARPLEIQADATRRRRDLGDS